MTAHVHPIPAGSPSDASAAQPSPCAAGAVIPAHAPRPDASAAPSPPRAAEAHDLRVALTQHELRALDFIRDMITIRGTAPTLIEVAGALGLQSRSNAHRIVESLVRTGLLIKSPSRLRGLALPDRPLLSSVPTAALRAELARRQEVL